MAYYVIKGTKQLNIEAKELSDEIYIPLEALYDDYTVLKENRVIFIDSPISNIEIGLINLNTEVCDPRDVLVSLLTGAGCKVQVLDKDDPIPSNINLVLELNPAEAVFQTSYGGYSLNGSKRLARDIGWAMNKIFELDSIPSPVKEKNLYIRPDLWKKITVPLISIKWRKREDSELLLAVSILMGLFRFASSQLPLIDEKIFFEENKIIEDNKILEESEILEESGEIEELKENKNRKRKQGKLVSNPSPKLQAYMKKIIAEQNSKAPDVQMGNIAPKETYGDLGKG